MIRDDRKASEKKRNLQNNIIIGNPIPDKSLNFPYESVWFSVKASGNNKVAEALMLKGVVETNWESGLDFAHEENCVFITPQVGEWVLVTGLDLPMGNSPQSFKRLERLLKSLSKEFGEAYFFACYKYYYCWAKSVDASIKRLYSYNGNSEGFTSIGEPIGVECKYRLVNKVPEDIPEEDQEYWEREQITFPDGELVFEIAADWNINPTKLRERTELAGLGLAGIFK